MTVSPGVHSGEHAVALQIDDLLGLCDRKGNRVIPVVMRICHRGRGLPNDQVTVSAVLPVLSENVIRRNPRLGNKMQTVSIRPQG